MLSAELAELATMMTVGGVCGLVYDSFRALVGPRPRRRLLAAAADLLFWTSAALIVGAGLFVTSSGRVRAVHLAGAALGASLYFIGFSPVLLPPMKRIVAVLRGVVGRSARCIRYLLGLPIRRVHGLVGGLGSWMSARVSWPAGPKGGETN